MPSIKSYFNPFSAKHNALESFKDLSAKKKAVTVTLTTLAAIVALPFVTILFPLVGMATFRALTNKFTKINLKEADNSPLVNSAKKTNDQSPGIYKPK